MRKLYKQAGLIMVLFLAFMLLATEPTVSQTIPKKPVFEFFTSSSCPPCVFGNRWAKYVLENFPGTYTMIKYQMYWPGVGDPYCIDDGRTRKTYYGVTGVPSLQINGTTKEHPMLFNADQMNNFLAEKTGVGMTITGSINEGKEVTVTVVITPELAYEAGLKVQIVVMERYTFNNATTNGEKIFDYVTQAVLPNAGGTTLDALVPGTPVTITLTKNMVGTHMETANDLWVAAFIQKDADKTVLQSEMAPVTHPFPMYNATLTVLDDDYNPVNAGDLLILQNSMSHVANGQASFTGYGAGTYTYEYTGPGYEDGDGTVTFPAANYTGEIIVTKPDVFFYENFGVNKVPDGWNFNLAAGTSANWNLDGTFYLYNSGETSDSYMVMPQVPLNQSGTMVIRAGQAGGAPVLAFGTVTGTFIPGSEGTNDFQVTGFEELGRVTLPAEGYANVNYRLTQGFGTKRPAFKFISDKDDYAYFDMVTIIEEMPGAKASFHVTDQSGNVLGNSQILFNGKTITVNDHGFSTFRDTDPGTYEYSLLYKGTVVKTGSVTFTMDDVDYETNRVIFELSYNTSGIEDPDEINAISLFPNPVKDHFTISGISTAVISVTTFEGKILMHKTVRDGETIETGNLPKGMYLVRIETENETCYRKMMVTR
jgi:hypothetical protein